jgi:hypothetical protein
MFEEAGDRRLSGMTERRIADVVSETRGADDGREKFDWLAYPARHDPAEVSADARTLDAMGEAVMNHIVFRDWKNLGLAL